MPAEPRRARAAVVTLGCKVNRADSEAIEAALHTAGLAVVGRVADADVVIVNTCTVTGEADAKARKAVRRAAARSGAVVIATGCLAAVDAASLEGLGDAVVVEAVKERVAALAARVTRAEPDGVEPAPPDVLRRAGHPRSRTRVAVKVQDGCDHRCAYCIVPDARGPARSEPLEEVVACVSRLVSEGTREVVLTGVDIGRWRGPDGDGLAGLVRAVASTGVERIRISSIEPLDLTDRLLRALASVPAVMPHLHVPLQSGSDRTLEAMGRGYRASEYADVLARARAAMPGLAVTTDVIAGFPGETDDDAAASLDFVERCGFARLHVFRYSRRAGTPAAAMSQVDARVVAARAAALRSLGDRMAAAYRASRIGGAADVLVESVSGGIAVGTSEDHLRVAVAGGGGARPGEVVRVVLGRAEGAVLDGVPVATAEPPAVAAGSGSIVVTLGEVATETMTDEESDPVGAG